MALPVEYLRCPHCGGDLALAGGAVRCPAGHSFDIARHGYVDLSGAGRRAAGDSAEMVAAREAFLAAGHFEVIASAVADEVAGVVAAGGEPGVRRTGDTAAALSASGQGAPAGAAGIEEGDTGAAHSASGQGALAGTAGIEGGDMAAAAAASGQGAPAGVARVDGGGRDANGAPGGGDVRGSGGAHGCVVEVGAGTGYYLSRARGLRVGIALDSSRYAARRAARAGLAAVVCDVWRGLPVRDGVAAAVLCVFAPRNAAEMRRILTPGGVIVVVTPTPRHLRELIEPLGLVRVDERKPERLAAALGEPVRVREIEAELRLSRDDVAALVAMGPSAHHVDAERVARPAVATLSVHVAVYR